MSAHSDPARDENEPRGRASTGAVHTVCHDCRGGTQVHGFASAHYISLQQLTTTYWPQACPTCECTGWRRGFTPPV